MGLFMRPKGAVKVETEALPKGEQVRVTEIRRFPARKPPL
jgi:hypothetical protein